MNNTNSLALILVASALFFFFGKPVFSEISIVQSEIEGYKSSIGQVNMLTAKKDELLLKLNSISGEDRKRVETFLPIKEGMIRLIADIDGVAARHGISISGVSFSETNNDVSSSVIGAPEPKPYQSSTINLSFSSNYQNFKQFLNDLEKSLRLIDIRSIELSQPSEVLNPDVYQYKISAEVYWIKNTPNEKQ
jgi:Tfp pilus assembly protein PilO